LQGVARVHYLLCDADGDCAVIEFLGGKMVVHQGATLPYRALANDPYEPSLDYLKAHPQTGKPPARAQDESSIARFAHAAARAAAFKPGEPGQDLAYAFDTLEQVCQGGYTAWRMVYDVSARRIYYRTRGNPQARTVDFKSIDFSAASSFRFVDIQASPVPGQSLPFEELTEARHRKYLEALCARESVRRNLGDLRPLLEGLVMILRTYAGSTGN
jgi:choloylglycine hydrolase